MRATLNQRRNNEASVHSPAPNIAAQARTNIQLPAPDNPIVRLADVESMVELLFQRRLAQGAPIVPSSRTLAQRITRSPFASSISLAPKPHPFQEPVFKVFDGKSNPFNHLCYYHQMMAYWSDVDATLCRSFSSSLGEKGLEWYKRLPEGQIRDFNELSELFLDRFHSARHSPKTLEDMYALRMRKSETLRSYVDRYWDLSDEVKDNVVSKVNAFKRGIQGMTGHTQLFDSLVIDPPTTT